MSKRARTWVVGVVVAVWVISVICTIFVDDYEPAESINAIFAAVIGGAVAYRNANHDDEDGGDTDADA